MPQKRWHIGIRVVPRAYGSVPSEMKRRGFFVWRKSLQESCKGDFLSDTSPFILTRKGETMKEQLERIKEEALKQIEASEALERLNEIRVSYLGKKGELTNILKSMKDVAPEDRPKVGQLVNEARAVIEGKLEEAKTALAKKSTGSAVKERGHRRDSSGKEESGGTQPPQYHCFGRSRAHFRGNGLRGGRGPGSRI